jgi:hypothetical protein
VGSISFHVHNLTFDLNVASSLGIAILTVDSNILIHPLGRYLSQDMWSSMKGLFPLLIQIHPCLSLHPTTPSSYPQPFSSSSSVPPPSQNMSPPDINSFTPPNDFTPTPQQTQHILVAAELPAHRPHQMVTRS